jgi:2-polyprenyl-6-methoxyphenol hydroxylase-like FAD-dependent oxidoreductase
MAEWLSPARTTKSTTNRWRHYERMSLPPGLLVMGDALCAFNPIFGQGISVAALQAEALSQVLRRRKPDDATLGATATRALARQVRFPWAMATSQDLHVPGTKGRLPRGSAMLDAYMNRIFALAARDGEVSLMISRVFNLVESPLALYAPARVVVAERDLPSHGPFRRLYFDHERA